jgi:hypothetical protein
VKGFVFFFCINDSSAATIHTAKPTTLPSHKLHRRDFELRLIDVGGGDERRGSIHVVTVNKVSFTVWFYVAEAFVVAVLEGFKVVFAGGEFDDRIDGRLSDRFGLVCK